MKSLMQRYASTVAVLGFALYLGWPESAPSDYGDNVVRAKAVRWRPHDLKHPPAVTPGVDPFREVLVTTGQTVVEPETGKLVAPTKPSGPPQSELKSGLRIDGIALMGGLQWAVINGRPRLPGDEVQTADANRHRCEVVAVESDRVVVRCQETTATLRPNRHPSAGIATPTKPAMEQATPTGSPARQIPPPPGN